MKFKQDVEDLIYLLDEVESTAKRNHLDISEDLVKIFTDLAYHGKKILKRLVVDYEHTIMSRDNSSGQIQRL